MSHGCLWYQPPIDIWPLRQKWFVFIIFIIKSPPSERFILEQFSVKAHRKWADGLNQFYLTCISGIHRPLESVRVGPSPPNRSEIFKNLLVLVRSDLGISEISSNLVRAGPGFIKCSRSWFEVVRDFLNFPVLVRVGPAILKFFRTHLGPD